MLDYTHNLRDEGIVRFRHPAAHYVPKQPGVYRIITVPFSYTASSTTATAAAYLNVFDGYKFDARQQLKARFTSERTGAVLRLRRTRRRHEPNLDEGQAKRILKIAALFPPFYIGKADVLRDRFLDHQRGFNSNVKDDLERLGLSHYVTFFHWHVCARPDLENLESILIQAYYPILNRKMR